MKALALIPAGFWWGVLGGLIPGVISVFVQHALQQRTEQKRRQPGLAVRLVTKDVYVGLQAATAFASAGALATLSGGVPVDPDADPPPPPPPPPKEQEPAHVGDRDVYHALIRNLSERPAAVVDVAFTRAGGEDIPIPKKREYARALGLPLVLGSWGVSAIQVQVDFPGLREAEILVLRDMDDKEIRVPLKDPGAWQRWFTYD